MTKIELTQQANELAAREILTETNSGTYSAKEAHQAIGVGDPAFADYRVYTRVGDGREREEGCDRDLAPGYARKFRDDLAREQAALRAIRKQIAGM